MAKFGWLVAGLLLFTIANITVFHIDRATCLESIIFQKQDEAPDEVKMETNLTDDTTVLTNCKLEFFDIIRNGTIEDNGEVARSQETRVHPMIHRHVNSTSVDHQIQPLGVLLHSHDSTYYHALVEFGSRLQYVLKYCPSAQVVWVIRASPEQNKLLSLLHDPPILEFIKYEPGVNYSSQTVLIPPPPYRVEDLLALRTNLMHRALPALSLFPALPAPQSSPTILFVQRVRRRAIINEEVVLSIFMASFPGNLTVFQEQPDLPLAEAVIAFHRADIVLGGHGGGLANIIFCRPGSRVFEIRRRGTPSEFTMQLAALFTLSHFIFEDPNLEPYRKTVHYDNFTVSTPSFRTFVEALK